MDPNLPGALVRRKIITDKQLKKAQEFQEKSGTHLFEALAHLGYTTEETIRDILAEIYDRPTIDLKDIKIDDTVYNLVPYELIRTHRLIPLKLLDSVLTIVMADPSLQAAYDVKYLTGYGAQVVLANASAITYALNHRWQPVGDAAEGQKVWLDCLEEAMEFGLQDTRLATSLGNLYEIYDFLRKRSEMKPLWLLFLGELQSEWCEDPDFKSKKHAELAKYLNHLVETYNAQGEDVVPITLQGRHPRDLENRKKALELEHQVVATVLENYARLLRKENINNEAANMEANARVIRSKHNRIRQCRSIDSFRNASYVYFPLNEPATETEPPPKH